MPLRNLRPKPAPMPGLPGTALVLVSCAAAIAVALGLLALFSWRDRSAAADRASGVASNVVLLVSEHAARLVETSNLLLRQVVDASGPPDAPVPTDRATWERLGTLAAATPYVVSITMTDAAGKVTLTSRQFPAPADDASGDATGQEYFERARRGQAGLFLSRQDVPGEHESLVVLSRPLPAAPGAFRGVATVTVSPRYFRDLYRNLDVGYAPVVALARPDGAVLVQEPVEAPPPEPGDVATQRRVDGFDLVARVAIPADRIMAAWMDRAAAYAVYGLAALLAVLGIGGLAYQRARRERRAEDALREAYDTLEERVLQRTFELQDTNTRLEGALEDKEVLLKEVQHRVKNNLQVICSLLRLQAGRLDDRSRLAFDESLRRIQSMSLVHELLYRSEEPARINFADYLRQLCDNLVRTGGPTPVRVVVEAKDWTVDVDRAMPLALIVSELVSNALRHAFPDHHAGTVRVELTPDATGVSLCVGDDGVGLPPDQPAPAHRRRSGLGLVLMQALARQANATVHIERGFREGGGGTRFTVSIPTAVERSKAA